MSTRNENTNLVRVDAVSPRDVWAVGNDGLHFDGLVWTTTSTPDEFGQIIDAGRWRGGDWAVGYGETPTLYRREADRWASLPAPGHPVRRVLQRHRRARAWTARGRRRAGTGRCQQLSAHRLVPMMESLSGQLRRGTLEYCVLALLRSGDRYALDIIRELGAVDGLVTSEGTIYPLLSRLRRDGLTETTWQESPNGPPRRYYGLTAAGREKLDQFVNEWVRFRDAVDSLVLPKERS